MLLPAKSSHMDNNLSEHTGHQVIVFSTLVRCIVLLSLQLFFLNLHIYILIEICKFCTNLGLLLFVISFSCQLSNTYIFALLHKQQTSVYYSLNTRKLLFQKAGFKTDITVKLFGVALPQEVQYIYLF